jgi:flagellar hook-length control protein FliK
MISAQQTLHIPRQGKATPAPQAGQVVPDDVDFAAVMASVDQVPIQAAPLAEPAPTQVVATAPYPVPGATVPGPERQPLVVAPRLDKRDAHPFGGLHHLRPMLVEPVFSASVLEEQQGVPTPTPAAGKSDAGLVPAQTEPAQTEPAQTESAQDSLLEPPAIQGLDVPQTLMPAAPMYPGVPTPSPEHLSRQDRDVISPPQQAAAPQRSASPRVEDQQVPSLAPHRTEPSLPPKGSGAASPEVGQDRPAAPVPTALSPEQPTGSPATTALPSQPVAPRFSQSQGNPHAPPRVVPASPAVANARSNQPVTTMSAPPPDRPTDDRVTPADTGSAGPVGPPRQTARVGFSPMRPEAAAPALNRSVGPVPALAMEGPAPEADVAVGRTSETVPLSVPPVQSRAISGKSVAPAPSGKAAVLPRLAPDIKKGRPAGPTNPHARSLQPVSTGAVPVAKPASATQPSLPSYGKRPPPAPISDADLPLTARIEAFKPNFAPELSHPDDSAILPSAVAAAIPAFLQDIPPRHVIDLPRVKQAPAVTGAQPALAEPVVALPEPDKGVALQKPRAGQKPLAPSDLRPVAVATPPLAAPARQSEPQAQRPSIVPSAPGSAVSPTTVPESIDRALPTPYPRRQMPPALHPADAAAESVRPHVLGVTSPEPSTQGKRVDAGPAAVPTSAPAPAVAPTVTPAATDPTAPGAAPEPAFTASSIPTPPPARTRTPNLAPALSLDAGASRVATPMRPPLPPAVAVAPLAPRSVVQGVLPHAGPRWPVSTPKTTAAGTVSVQPAVPLAAGMPTRISATTRPELGDAHITKVQPEHALAAPVAVRLLEKPAEVLLGTAERLEGSEVSTQRQVSAPLPAPPLPMQAVANTDALRRTVGEARSSTQVTTAQAEHPPLRLSPAQAISQFQHLLNRTDGDARPEPGLPAPLQPQVALSDQEAGYVTPRFQQSDGAEKTPRAPPFNAALAKPHSDPKPAPPASHVQPDGGAHPPFRTREPDSARPLEHVLPAKRSVQSDPAPIGGSETRASAVAAEPAQAVVPVASVTAESRPPIYSAASQGIISGVTQTAAQGLAGVAAGPTTRASHAPTKPFATSIAHSVTQSGHSRAEIVLEPAELGRLHFNIVTDGAQIQVNLTVERPETLVLLRAHAEDLRQEFRAAGIDTSSLSFGQWDRRGDAPPGPEPGAEDSAPLPMDSPSLVPIPARRIVSGSGLDLRL